MDFHRTLNCTNHVGAFVAGLKSGLLFPTFPMMGNEWIPAFMGKTLPVWLDPINNPVTVQFIHRWLGTFVLGWAIWVTVNLRKHYPGSLLAWFVGTTTLQFTLGALTVLFLIRNQVFWGTLHQFGALILLFVAINTLYRTARLGRQGAHTASEEPVVSDGLRNGQLST